MANHQSFTPSVKVKNYQKKQEEYESAYQKAMANLASSPLGVGVQDALNAIANRTPFSYDFNADGLYAQYKNQYQKQGELAMQDTLARASELTGGYGNSYGVTAGMQAYQSQMENLNNMIPKLYSLAYERYQNQTKELEAEYNRQLALEQETYKRQQTAAEDALTMAKYYGALGQDTLSFEADLWESALKRADTLAQLEYQKQRDNVADAQWQKEYALAVQKAALSAQKQEEKQTANTLVVTDSATWGAGEWEKYFANLRSRYGSQKAMDSLKYMISAGLLPEDMISFGVLGAQGKLQGH